MGFQAVRKIAALGLLLVAFPAGRSAPRNAHAVTGTVVSLADNRPVAGALVAAVDKFGYPIVSDTSSAERGVYLLSVPTSHQQFALLFRHKDFMEDVTEYINNTEARKFGDKPLIPANVGQMRPADVEKLGEWAETFARYGQERDLPIYRAVGRRNLERLLNSFTPADAEGVGVQSRLQARLQRTAPPATHPGAEIFKPPPTTAGVVPPAAKPEVRVPEIKSTRKPPPR